MSDQSTPARLIHHAIQASAALNDNLEGSVLTGWVTACEWMAADGSRWFSWCSGGGVDGEQSPTSWQTKGLLYEGLASIDADAQT